MRGLDPSISGKSFSGLRCASPENDAKPKRKKRPCGRFVQS